MAFILGQPRGSWNYAKFPSLYDCRWEWAQEELTWGLKKEAEQYLHARKAGSAPVTVILHTQCHSSTSSPCWGLRGMAPRLTCWKSSSSFSECPGSDVCTATCKGCQLLLQVTHITEVGDGKGQHGLPFVLGGLSLSLLGQLPSRLSFQTAGPVDSRFNTRCKRQEPPTVFPASAHNSMFPLLSLIL